MAQSATTVTPPSPTPPTNFSSTGATPPNPPNYTKNTYTDYATDTDFDTYPPPYYDDGTAASGIVFAANTAALASGSAATAGGTEGTYPGTGTTGNFLGAVPASSSVAHEGAGAETLFTQTYTAAGANGPGVYRPAGDLQMVGAGPAWSASPNQNHASTLSPATNPALASISPTTAVSGASGTDTITSTGTNFTRQSVMWVQHGTLAPVPLTTTFVSATSLTAPVPKRTTAGASTIYVVTGGVVSTVTKALTYS